MKILKRFFHAGLGFVFGFALGLIISSLAGSALSLTTNFDQIDLADPYTDGQTWYGAETALSVGGTAPTITAGTNNYYHQFTVANSTDSVIVPLHLVGRTGTNKGYKITNAKVVYNLSASMAQTAGGITPELYKVTAPAHGSALTGAVVTTTYDASHDTYAERNASGSHTATLNISSPAFAANNEGYFFKLTADGDGTATIQFWGIQINYQWAPL